MIDKIMDKFIINEPKGNGINRQARRLYNKAAEAKALGAFSLGSGIITGTSPVSAPASILGGVLLYKGGEYSAQYKNLISSQAYKDIINRASKIKIK